MLSITLLSASGCETPPRLVTLDVTPGHEIEAFSVEPAVSNVQIDAISEAGDTLASVQAAPGASFAIGDFPVEQLLRFEVQGFDDTTTLRMRGRSLSLLPGAVQAEVLPLFAQRLAGWSRPPGELPSSRIGGTAVVIGERYLLLAGGQATSGDDDRSLTYDLLSLGGNYSITLPRSPQSMLSAVTGQAVLLVADDGATWFDFSDGSVTEASVPAGMSSFAEVAGGRVVSAGEATYLVGAGRAADPSDQVLVLSAAGELSSARLNAPRSDAATVWVPERGLAVAGGSSTAAGLELLTPGASVFTSYAFPSDATVGATGVATDEDTLWLAGGETDGQAAPLRRLDLSCAADCAAQPFDLGIDATLRKSYGFAVDAARLLLIGTDEQVGLLRSYLIALSSPPMATELPLREPRRGAVPLATPNGTLMVLGGQLESGEQALTVESFFPE